MEIVPGIHRVDGVLGCTAYLLVDDDLTLVDTGLSWNGPRILNYIKRIGGAPKDLARIVLTHGHPDHAGSAAWLRQATGAQVLIHRGDTRMDADGTRWVHYVSQPVAFRRDVPLFHRLPIDGLLKGSTTLPVLGGARVVHTPGHTPGSVCLHLPRLGVLLTGDTLLGHRRWLSRPLPLPGYDWGRYSESLRVVAGLEFDVLCGGHGIPIVGGASRHLHHMIEVGAMGSYLSNLRYRFMAIIGVGETIAGKCSGSMR